MTKIILNADDFGLCEGVNYGIMESHLNGLLTSTTMMVTMPGTNHAVEMMKNLPKLGVGLHLNISLGKPLTNGKSLVDENGNFTKPQQLVSDKYLLEELLAEFRAQYEKFVKLTGVKPTHLDSHLFSSDHIASVRDAITIVGNENEIPVRNIETNKYNKVEFITFRKYNDPIGLDYLFDRVDDFDNYDYIEIMSHPGYVDNFILENSSYNKQRLNELEIITSSRLKSLFEDKKFEMITYRDIKSKDGSNE